MSHTVHPSHAPSVSNTLAGLALMAVLGLAPGATAAPPSFAKDVRPLLARYCADCHTGDTAESGIAFDRLDETAARTTQRASWQKVLRQVEASVMPPADAEQPSAEERAVIARWVAEFALVPDCSAGERPGRVTLRRLNRTEYDATVRDLFGCLLYTSPSPRD